MVAIRGVVVQVDPTEKEGGGPVVLMGHTAHTEKDMDMVMDIKRNAGRYSNLFLFRNSAVNIKESELPL